MGNRSLERIKRDTNEAAHFPLAEIVRHPQISADRDASLRANMQNVVSVSFHLPPLPPSRLIITLLVRACDYLSNSWVLLILPSVKIALRFDVGYFL